MKTKVYNFVLFLILAVFFFLSFASAGPPDKTTESTARIEEADRLGEEFQLQVPWSIERPGSGGFYGMPQPEEYFSTPERELPPKEPEYKRMQYPLCYSPYTRRYDYCYPRDSYYFHLRFRSPEFRFWWESWRTCPPGYYFKSGWGCYRY